MYLPPRVLFPLGLSALLLVVALGILLLRPSQQEPIQVILPAASAATAELKVYVSGAVQSPAVYVLGSEDRVEDALRAAGGPADGADLDRINLASKLRDGDHLLVPRRGETLPPNTAGAPKLNLNAATQRELEALPGIGEVRARQVIESRTSEGLFLDSTELLTRQILPLSVYERVKDLVTTR